MHNIAMRDEQKDEILTEWTSQTTIPTCQSDKDRRQGQTEESDKDRRERYKTLHCVMYRERTHTNGYVVRESVCARAHPPLMDELEGETEPLLESLSVCRRTQNTVVSPMKTI